MVSSMLLVVDVGNTQTHFGTFDGDQLVEHWRFATVRVSTADELGAALRNLLELRGCSFEQLDASIVSSTVPQLEPEWTTVAERYYVVEHGKIIDGFANSELTVNMDKLHTYLGV